MREFLASLLLCALVGIGTVAAQPYRGTAPDWWPRERVRIVYACPQGYVCFPAKDEARHENSGLLPTRMVQITAFRSPAADIPPAVQAQDTARKKKSSKR